MSALAQPSLFGGGRPAFDPIFRGMRREALGDGAWLDYLPGWLEGHETVYESLAADSQWAHQRRQMYDRVVDVPRLTAAAPRRGETASLLRRMSVALSTHYSLALPGISLAWYRDGRDSVAFHGDRMGPLVDDTVVAIVSVGAPRRFLLRPVAGGPSRAWSPGWGDLLVMGGTCQRTFQHGIPKSAAAEPRISIQFRPEIPGGR